MPKIESVIIDSVTGERTELIYDAEIMPNADWRDEANHALHQVVRFLRQTAHAGNNLNAKLRYQRLLREAERIQLAVRADYYPFEDGLSSSDNPACFACGHKD